MLRLAIGVDIGGTRTKFGLVNPDTGDVLQTIVKPTEKKDEVAFLEQVGLTIQQLMDMAKHSRGVLEGIGFGVPGFVNGSGIVDSTYGFLEFMEDYPLAGLIQHRFAVPCRIDNDARVVALGEALFGKGRGFERVLVLTLGTGLGFGLVVSGAFPEALPFAHMGGHICIKEKGEPCYCGKSGCLENLVSSQGITAAASKINWGGKYPQIPATAEGILSAAATGNADAQMIAEELVAYLDIGLNNYINLFAPDIIVLGGGIAKGLRPFLEKLNSSSYLKPYKTYHTTIALSELDEQSGILGAAALFRT